MGNVLLGRDNAAEVNKKKKTSVFGTMAAWMILGQYLNEFKILGIVIILSAVIFSQLAPMYDKRKYGRN